VPETRLTLADLAADPARAMSLSPADATEMLARVGAVEAVLRARIVTATTVPWPESRPTTESPARMLTLAEVAERSGKSIRWWRENWRTEIPSATKKGRTVLVPEEEFAKWRHK